jgi:murein DD-endopeptidase MepM/ murein hydrolase activator NlpD
MQKDNRFYTLIIAPATSSRIYKIMLHHRHLYAITIAGLVGFALLTLMSIWVFKQAGLLVHYHRIKHENQLLKQKQLAVLQKLESRLASVEAESDHVRQMAEKIGLDLDVELKSDEASSSGGLGGPSPLDSLANKLDRVHFNLKLLRDNLDAEKTRLARTPMGWPIPGRTNSGYGVRRDPFDGGYEFHAGVDIGASHGRPVRATADGVVAYTGYYGGYGQLVILDHGQGIQTYYGHLSRIDVSVGERLQRNDQLGRVGSTGRATGAHVHYEIRVNDRPVNPKRFRVAP